ncbi:hypothetical protein SBADM41S_06861 [Streptomyces badius]
MPAETHLSNVKNVAAETGFYTILDQNFMPTTVIEHDLSRLERHGLAIPRQTDHQRTVPAAGTHHRQVLRSHMPVQMTRTPGKRTAMLCGRDVTAYAADAWSTTR